MEKSLITKTKRSKVIFYLKLGYYERGKKYKKKNL